MKLSLITITAIFLPFIFGLYLLIKKIRFSFVEKSVINNGLIVINSLTLLAFCAVKFFHKTVNFGEYGFLIDSKNIYFLIFSSFVYLILSIFLKKYFKEKKKYIFTKQRLYIFLPLLITITYLFLSASNLFVNLIFWFLSGLLIYVFSYFDIFKYGANYNPICFYWVFLFGDLCFLIFLLGCPYEPLIGVVCLLVAILTRFFVFYNASKPLFLSSFLTSYMMAGYLFYIAIPYLALLKDFII